MNESEEIPKFVVQDMRSLYWKLPRSKTDIRIFAKDEQTSSRSYVMRGKSLAWGTANSSQCAFE